MVILLNGNVRHWAECIKMQVETKILVYKLMTFVCPQTVLKGNYSFEMMNFNFDCIRIEEGYDFRK